VHLDEPAPPARWKTWTGLSLLGASAARAESGQELRLRRHDGYDHSYYFIASFVDDHLAHHARALAR